MESYEWHEEAVEPMSSHSSLSSFSHFSMPVLIRFPLLAFCRQLFRWLVPQRTLSQLLSEFSSDSRILAFSNTYLIDQSFL